jgi:hypothetical protein
MRAGSTPGWVRSSRTALAKYSSGTFASVAGSPGAPKYASASAG